eukprot:TRINITY_DN5675_c0_g1_i4.p1 TRINITY_DN5675_c0_g1~~TRINITY_DN5675_c0_g1_i4.p1  ORF type:complete len:138 (+),score=25.41 TRINITY_DN5675_c0_g1_i4:202-615(+)
MTTLFSLILLFVLYVSGTTQNINLKPGTPGSARIQEGPVSVKFQWSVDGGTNEDWEMTLEETGDQYLFSLGRPQSYLFFRSFKIQVSGSTIKSVETYNNEGLVTLEKLSVKTKSVSSNGWQGELSAFMVYIAKKQDL